MSTLTTRDVLNITGGTAHHITQLDEVLTTAIYDSREAQEGSLFLAIEGTKTDGHLFAGDAVSRGARLVLASRPVSHPCVVVADVISAITLLAQENRKRINCPVLAITGSSGKTSTKDLLIDLLQPLGDLVAPAGSRNNELGLPSTLFAANRDTAAVILEMGARHKGNIAQLCEIAQPTIAGITTIGSAHIGEFGSLELIAETKGEIIANLPSTAIAVLNADEVQTRKLSETTLARVVLAGYSSEAEIRLTEVVLDQKAHPTISIETPLGRLRAKLNLVGEHQAMNAAIAIGMALAAGIPVDTLEARLESAHPRSPLRMQVFVSKRDVTVLNDSYNANPESMLAALETLKHLAESSRSFAVLGEMAELGDISVLEHQKLGRAIAELNISRFIGVGAGLKVSVESAIEHGMNPTIATWVSTQEEALQILRHELKSRDVVLVKASRAAGFDHIAALLAAQDQAGGE
jgi:UDP-N-acetylmuramoyl-tripeptide--D-alanyl-D-alanine ligase